MSFLTRLSYFVFGVVLGSILVIKLLIRDREFPAWLPEDRVLEELAVDSLIISEAVSLPFSDSILMERIKDSDVLFSESVVRNQRCKEYQLESENERMRFEICPEAITLMEYRPLQVD